MVSGQGMFDDPILKGSTLPIDPAAVAIVEAAARREPDADVLLGYLFGRSS